MLFSSMIFIWIFLPVVWVGNLILQKINGNATANILLLVASVFFYAWGEPVYVLLMLTSIFINWVSGLFLGNVEVQPENNGAQNYHGTIYRRIVLAISVALNLGILGYFKYAGMLVGTINALAGTELEDPEIVLPIGISFFTFQALSYVIDVYRGDCRVQRNVLKMALYISFFPQLIAGPIVKYRDVAEQIDHRSISAEQTASGTRRFCYGLAKKTLISNVLASAADSIYVLDPSDVSCALAWTASILYTLQIYYDFSGYSDMAIGLGRMFGFEFKENFDYPYTATSIREFWRRWHISLSSWFREYVYIPLGGNRQGVTRTYLNLFIVFFLTGLWHGARWSYVFWGLYHGVWLILERAGFSKWLDRHKGFAFIYTMLLVNFGWVFFRVEEIEKALLYIERMVMPWNYLQGSYSVFEYVDLHTFFIIACAVIGMGLLQRSKVMERLEQFKGLEMVYCFLLLFLSLLSLASNTYNPFIYFRF